MFTSWAFISGVFIFSADSGTGFHFSREMSQNIYASAEMAHTTIIFPPQIFKPDGTEQNLY